MAENIGFTVIFGQSKHFVRQRLLEYGVVIGVGIRVPEWSFITGNLY